MVTEWQNHLNNEHTCNFPDWSFWPCKIIVLYCDLSVSTYGTDYVESLDLLFCCLLSDVLKSAILALASFVYMWFIKFYFQVMGHVLLSFTFSALTYRFLTMATVSGGPLASSISCYMCIDIMAPCQSFEINPPQNQQAASQWLQAYGGNWLWRLL